MHEMISVALFALGVSAAPKAIKTPVAVPLTYIPGYEQHYPLHAHAFRSAAYMPHHYQVAPLHPAPQLSAYRYQPQQPLVKYQATEINAASPVIASPVVPAPVLKGYPQHVPQPQWAILRSNLDNNFDGHFQYDFETENGISMAAAGAVRQVAPDAVGQVMQGQYSYTSPEGQVITTSYTADENGFVATGDHLPQAPSEPELPPLIAKSLAYIRSIPPRPEFQQ